MDRFEPIFTEKKQQNYGQSNDNGCNKNDYNIDSAVNKSSENNGHNIKTIVEEHPQ